MQRKLIREDIDPIALLTFFYRKLSQRTSAVHVIAELNASSSDQDSVVHAGCAVSRRIPTFPQRCFRTDSEPRASVAVDDIWIFDTPGSRQINVLSSDLRSVSIFSRLDCIISHALSSSLDSYGLNFVGLMSRVCFVSYCLSRSSISLFEFRVGTTQNKKDRS